MASIKHKDDFVELWMLGMLGNKVRGWRDYAAYLAETDKPGYINMRTRRQHGGGFVEYGIHECEISDVLWDWQQKGVDRSEVFFNAPAPDEYLVIQGELMRSTNFYELTYSTYRGVKMRDAMKCPKLMNGPCTLYFLKQWMTEYDWDDLNGLLDEFPDDVIEFGIYERELGELPGRKLVTWEIRSY